MALYRCSSGSGTAHLTETILWSNNSPSSAFANQVVSSFYNMHSYDYIGVYYRPKANTNFELMVIVPESDFENMTYSTDAVMMMSYYSGYYARAVWYVNDYDIHFSDSLQVGGSGNSNGTSVPTRIVGLKLETS